MRQTLSSDRQMCYLFEPELIIFLQKTLTTSCIRELGVRMGLRAAVFAKRLLFGDVGVQVDQRRHKDVGGIHDLVAHDDLSERHAVQLLLSVRFNRLDLGLTCTSIQRYKCSSVIANINADTTKIKIKKMQVPNI